jgi:hypothetical protein
MYMYVGYLEVGLGARRRNICFFPPIPMHKTITRNASAYTTMLQPPREWLAANNTLGHSSATD